LDIDSSIGNLFSGVNDLDSRISAFDLYVDRVMQIGLFAIACSNDIKSILHSVFTQAHINNYIILEECPVSEVVLPAWRV
jgi:hypothetical protein